jgi:hypothetical protein
MAIRKSTDGFIRQHQGAVINTDNEALRAYKARKAKNNEVEQLKGEVAQLKGLLHAILEKLDK